MARIRSIKPGFFRSEDVSALPMRARLTWIGLWTQCDDQGRAKDNPRLIKGDVWPLDDVSLADIEEDLSALAANGRIARYEVDGKRYLEVANWSEHQKIDRPTKSVIPPPSEGTPYSPNGRRALDEPSEEVSPKGTAMPEVIHRRALDESSTSPRVGKGRERKGGEGTRARGPSPADGTSPPEQEPPPKCPEHQHLAKPPPCGDCADARKAHEAWHADRRARLAAEPQCRAHRGQLARNCGGCAADRKAATT